MTSGYRLTRRALLDLREIHSYSQENWGSERADQYMTALYQTFSTLAEQPVDKQRARRSQPFLMTAAQSHFIIHDLFEGYALILAVMHKSRDIEQCVSRLSTTFQQQAHKLKAQLQG